MSPKNIFQLAFFERIRFRAGARSKTLGWRQQTKSQNIGVAAGVAANEKSKYWGGSCHPCHPSSTGPVRGRDPEGITNFTHFMTGTFVYIKLGYLQNFMQHFVAQSYCRTVKFRTYW